jgi:hypothetical protein
MSLDINKIFLESMKNCALLRNTIQELRIAHTSKILSKNLHWLFERKVAGYGNETEKTTLSEQVCEK